VTFHFCNVRVVVYVNDYRRTVLGKIRARIAVKDTKMTLFMCVLCIAKSTGSADAQIFLLS